MRALLKKKDVIFLFRHGGINIYFYTKVELFNALEEIREEITQEEYLKFKNRIGEVKWLKLSPKGDVKTNCVKDTESPSFIAEKIKEKAIEHRHIFYENTDRYWGFDIYLN
ncbi:MAG: hypothetical protein U9R00_01260 [Patescibacteria group bacterium]|nr:hypothetical protein [Patescibacteria group bacterium]